MTTPEEIACEQEGCTGPCERGCNPKQCVQVRIARIAWAASKKETLQELLEWLSSVRCDPRNHVQIQTHLEALLRAEGKAGKENHPSGDPS